MTVAAKKGMNVQLESDCQMLQGVEVVAYGTQKKVTITGAISSVKGEELTKPPVSSVSQVLAGAGSFAGDMNLYKSMQGSVEIAANLNHTGKNVISEGTLAVEGTIMGMVELQARGTLAGNPIIKGELQFEGALNYEGCRLSPGTEKNPYGQITVAHDLTINQAIYVEENIKSEGEKQQDRFVVLGNLNKKLSPILHSQAGWGIFLLYSHPHLTGKRQGSICHDEQGAYRPFL